PTMGRQVFRAGRRSPSSTTAVEDPLAGPTGLFTDPDLGDDPVAGVIASLCRVSLRLELSRHDAAHDPLTGLYNRRAFDAMVEQSAYRSARYGWRFLLVLLDLDRFKVLNDQLGHDAGDRVLRSLGTELRHSLRTGDSAARLGGDELALLLHNGDSRSIHSLLERTRVAVGRAVGIEVSFSSGSASAPDESTDFSELYRLADTRLYQHKARLTEANPRQVGIGDHGATRTATLDHAGSRHPAGPGHQAGPRDQTVAPARVSTVSAE
ncbi:MAG: GGDEF domain-containing protein, partial [Acidimicrobiales bacterium]